MNKSKILTKCIGILVMSISHFLFSQSFTKITTGPVVNDGGWCYGSCWGDFNGDGYQDLFVVNNMTSNKNNFMYLNNGDGTFTKVTSGVVVNDGGSSYGCSYADYDNDGKLDLFVTNYGENNFLYHGNGDGSFTKITTGSIVSDGGNSTGCAWGDYDNDGYIDLFVCNRNQPNFLYHNNGNGTFTRITTGPVATDNSNSGGCAWGDYDNDGYPDLFVANAGPSVNFLYHNNGNGTFTKITNSPVVSDSAHHTGGSWGDYDNDGYLDLFVTCGLVGSGYDILYHNNGNSTFTRITSDPIVSYNHWAGGAGWMDFNNDGFLDMFVGGYDGINLLFLNNGNGTFTRIDTGAVVNDGNYKMGASWGDYNNDGQVDLFVARNNYFSGNNVLYMNNGNTNKWINIKCVGMVSNKSGIGAKVYVKAIINGNSVTQLKEISAQTGGSISGECELNAMFGLGNAPVIDSLRIKWPSGIVDRYAGVQVNQFVTAIEGQGLSPVEKNTGSVPSTYQLFQNYPNPFNPATKIKFSIPQLLLTKGAGLPAEASAQARGMDVQLTIYDILGRSVATLVNEQLKPGTYEVEWNALNFSSGTYFYKLTAGDYTDTRKMILLK